MRQDSKIIEDVKRFWDSRPCNIKHSLKEVGTKEYFEEVDAKKFFVESHIVEFVKFENWKDKRVLDIGCGIGSAATKFIKAGALYTGIELSSESLELTKQHLAVYGLEAEGLYLGNAEELDSFLPIQTFDLIYSFGVIHHSPKPRKIVKQCLKYMNADSVFKIMLYAKNSWKNYMIEAGLDQPEAQHGCPIADTYTEEEVNTLLWGMTNISIIQEHLFPYQVEPYKKGLYIKQPWFEAMPKDMFKALEKKLGWHLLITAVKSL